MVANRNTDLAQHFTPLDIAEELVAAATSGKEKCLSILEPSCGDGIFIQILAQLDADIIIAIDIDANLINGLIKNNPFASNKIEL